MLCERSVKHEEAKKNNANILDKDTKKVYVAVALSVCNGTSHCKRILELDKGILPIIPSLIHSV